MITRCSWQHWDRILVNAFAASTGILSGKQNQVRITWVERTCFYINIDKICSTHYQTTHFTRFQIQKLCRRQFKIWRKWQKVIQPGRKHCGKRKNCSLRAISLFPQCFQKSCFPGVSKGVIVWKWVKLNTGYLADINKLTLSQTSPGFNVSVVRVQGKHCGKRRNCL